MKRFRCGDVVPGCAQEFSGTETAILEQVGEHAASAHGMTTVSPELVDAVRSRMTAV